MILSEIKNIVVYSGSGISAESGIQTFRDIFDGLWYQYNVEEVATKKGWKKDKEKVLRFYNERRSQLKNVYPNKGHLDLVKLEAQKQHVLFYNANFPGIFDIHKLKPNFRGMQKLFNTNINVYLN
jgi:NAD-dependent SIR2 family protein deacetylase